MGERANRREASFGHGLTPINTDSRGCFAPTDTGAKSLLYRRKSARLMSGSRAVILPFICLRTRVLGRLEDSAASICLRTSVLGRLRFASAVA